MAAFRLYGQSHTFFDNTGQLLAGGQLKFYQAGTTTPQVVYGDKGLTINNGSTVALDAAGRPSVDIWASTASAYYVEWYDALGTKQGQEDHVEVPGGSGQSVPVPASNYFLTGDGTNFATSTVRQVPDPTGNANKVLSTDGSVLTWIAKPADGATPTLPPLPSGGITVTTYSITAGKLVIQGGSGTASSSGSHTTSGAVTFTTAYASAPKIFVTPSGSGVTPDGYYVVSHVTSRSTSGFTAGFNVNEDGSESGKNIAGTVNFDWLAIGTVP